MVMNNWGEIAPSNLFRNNRFYQWLTTVFADKNHTHTISDVNYLQTALDTKADKEWTDLTSTINNQYVQSFVVNTSLKLAYMKYYRPNYNFNTTSEIVLHTGLIPSTYRPAFSPIGHTYNPTIGFMIEASTGNIAVNSSSTGTKAINATIWWYY